MTDYAQWLKTHKLVGGKWVPITAAPTAPPSPAVPGPEFNQMKAPTPPAPTGDVSWQDSTYQDTKSGLDKSLENLKGYLLNQGNALGLNTGVEFTRDPNNPLVGSNFHIADNVDLTNPYSTAALLKKTHDQHAKGNTNSYAAAGQLYSGSLQNAQNAETFNYGAGQDQLLKGFSSQFGDLLRRYQEGQDTGGTDLLAAQAAALERHKNDPAPDPTYNTGGAAAPGSSVAQAANMPQGTQPKEAVGDAVKKYLAAQKKKTAAKKPKHPKYGATGGARAPGG